MLAEWGPSRKGRARRSLRQALINDEKFLRRAVRGDGVNQPAMHFSPRVEKAEKFGGKQGSDGRDVLRTGDRKYGLGKDRRGLWRGRRGGRRRRGAFCRLRSSSSTTIAIVNRRASGD